MVQYRRALMRHDISDSALVTKWFMSCDAPLCSILKPGLLGMHTCSENVCSGSNCRRDQHIASLPPIPVLTDMKGAAWAGYHGNRCTLHSVVAAVGFWCRTVFPEPWLDTIAAFNGMFSILLSLFSRSPLPIHSVVWPHYPAKVVPSSKMAVNHEDGVKCSLSPHTERGDVAFVDLWSMVLCVVLYFHSKRCRGKWFARHA